MYIVKFTSRAAKDFDKLSKAVQSKILDSIELLRINPFAEILQFKKLRGGQNLYRIRVGNYRILYEVKGELLLIVIVRLGYRKDVYRYLKER